MVLAAVQELMTAKKAANNAKSAKCFIGCS